ncbi:hypothetical protein M426DRAFT_12936 [Hypoxylon sp. CI-4A]|nr:hypothetical protein M426DRAFT_12936 [Hypoxylon sp. CI-4A]
MPRDTGHNLSWDLPPTPTDFPYAGTPHMPYHVDNSWMHVQEDIQEAEEEAEKLAEQDLASAGKLFSDMTSPLDGSNTSPFPNLSSSFPNTNSATRTEFTIRTYSSNDTLDGAEASAEIFQLVESSDNETVGPEEEKVVKVLEFSREEEQAHKATRSHTRGPAPNEAGRAQSNLFKKQSDKKVYQNKEDESSSSSGMIPRYIGSSMAVHTGHSIEELQPAAASTSTALTTIDGRRRRIRRPSRV